MTIKYYGNTASQEAIANLNDADKAKNTTRINTATYNTDPDLVIPEALEVAINVDDIVPAPTKITIDPDGDGPLLPVEYTAPFPDPFNVPITYPTGTTGETVTPEIEFTFPDGSTATRTLPTKTIKTGAEKIGPKIALNIPADEDSSPTVRDKDVPVSIDLTGLDADEKDKVDKVIVDPDGNGSLPAVEYTAPFPSDPFAPTVSYPELGAYTPTVKIVFTDDSEMDVEGSEITVAADILISLVSSPLSDIVAADVTDVSYQIRIDSPGDDLDLTTVNDGARLAFNSVSLAFDSVTIDSTNPRSVLVTYQQLMVWGQWTDSTVSLDFNVLDTIKDASGRSSAEDTLDDFVVTVIAPPLSVNLRPTLSLYAESRHYVYPLLQNGVLPEIAGTFKLQDPEDQLLSTSLNRGNIDVVDPSGNRYTPVRLQDPSSNPNDGRYYVTRPPAPLEAGMWGWKPSNRGYDAVTDVEGLAADPDIVVATFEVFPDSYADTFINPTLQSYYDDPSLARVQDGAQMMADLNTTVLHDTPSLNTLEKWYSSVAYLGDWGPLDWWPDPQDFNTFIIHTANYAEFLMTVAPKHASILAATGLRPWFDLTFDYWYITLNHTAKDWDETLNQWIN